MTPEDDFKKYVINTFGKSVYQIQLDIAIGRTISGDAPAEAWKAAIEFIDDLHRRTKGEYS